MNEGNAAKNVVEYYEGRESPDYKFRAFESEIAAEAGLNEAIVLGRLHYLASRTNEVKLVKGERWICKSINEWQEQFGWWSEGTVKRIFNSLRSKELVIVKVLGNFAFDRTLWYQVNYEHELIKKYCPRWIEEVKAGRVKDKEDN